MACSMSWLGRTIASCLVLLMAVPLGEAATTPLPSAPQPAISSPDSGSNSGETQPGSSSANLMLAQAVDQNQQPANSQSSETTQQNPAPVGTAAAPEVKGEGVVASRPAGSAIAPAKQRRTHTIAIRVALIVGAGVAIGTVAAASLGSPARPH